MVLQKINFLNLRLQIWEFLKHLLFFCKVTEVFWKEVLSWLTIHSYKQDIIFFTHKINVWFGLVVVQYLYQDQHTWGEFFNSSGVNSSECLLPFPISKLIFLSRAPIVSDTVLFTPGLTTRLLVFGHGLELSKTSAYMKKSILPIFSQR